MWHLEGRVIPAQVVPVTHPAIMNGNEEDEYGSILLSAAELYGILRRSVVEHVLLAQTIPVMGYICTWNTDDPDIIAPYFEERHFLIEYAELHRFLNHFLGDTLSPEERIRWQEEGF